MRRHHEQRDPQREQQWRKTIQRQQRSGLTIREFCAGNGLHESAFYFWRREIERRDSETRHEESATPAFVPLQVVADQSPCLEVELGGVVVRVPSGFDAETLTRLLATLEAR